MKKAVVTLLLCVAWTLTAGDQQAQRIILLFKGIDQNSYLPL